MKRKSAILGFAAVASMALWSPSHAQTLRVLSSWDTIYQARSILLEQYVKGVQEASKGALRLAISGPETVPPFEQLQPVSTGAFQMLFSHSAYHTGNTSYTLPIDGLKGESKQWREAGLYEMIDKHYSRFGLKLIFLAKSPEGAGYQIILRNPVGPTGDLQGRKIRGTQTYSGVLTALGASPVVLPPAEIYTSLEKGVVDGASWPVIGVQDYRWNEVAKYLLRPTFGVTAYALYVNIKSWNALPEAQKAILIEQGRKVEESWPSDWVRLAKAEEASLLGKGMQITELGVAQKGQVGAAFEKGLWDLAAGKEPRPVGELREFVRQKGLSN
jgi:TRAP-type mannitol/chloroaromatic compound transport system substrate-binding protein